MQDFRKLKVWQRAHQNTLAVYRLTNSFPETERFGLVSQMRRCAVSVPSNIAEGCGRGSDVDFARYVQIAMGSCSELEYQLLLAHDLGYHGDAAYRSLNSEVTDVKRMLSGLLSTLRRGAQS